MNRQYRPKKRSGWPVWLAASATLVFGLALLIKPDLTTNLILNILGGALIAAGAYKVVRYFMNRDPYDIFSWDLALGVILACGGLSLIVFKRMLLSIVPLMFGIAMLVCGVVKLQAAFTMKRMLNRRWYFTLIATGVSCILGLLIILHPFGTGLALIRLIGASIAIEAIQDILSLRNYDKAVEAYFVK